tara:strand:+ start:169 stop:543 length:375 start_codon:yes stop_codon:yes gene_type:complete
MNRHEFLNNVLPNNTGFIILRFTAEWCSPCKSINSYIDEKKKLLTNNISYIEIDVDEHIDLYSFFKHKKMIKGIPAFLCYKKGNITFAPDYSVIGANISELDKFFSLILDDEVKSHSLSSESHY